VIFIAIIIAAALTWLAFAVHPGLGILVAVLAYGAIDGLRSRH
jgi:hypothetical protein